ncbi:MAG: exonuclease SbcCD subunit D [Bacteriovoracaceae bacterium]|nr:exonuclease SbcCD subunit D [Bacteriovoracaceae bacterium]
MGLRLLHTSDWHLGKKLFKTDRTFEQKLFLDWLIDLIKDENIHGLLVCGDVFDCPLPPASALELYFNFLSRLTSQTTCKIYIIPGNHDSGKFLGAPSGFLKKHNIHISGNLLTPENDNFQKSHLATIEENGIKANMVFLPYFRTHEILNLYENFKANGHLSKIEEDEDIFLPTLETFFKHILQTGESQACNILLAHHLFGGFEMSGSEQMISLSSLESIPFSILENHFDYAALGHIHKTMELKKSSPNAHYCGAPMAFRFNEKGQKHVILLDIDNVENKHRIQTRKIPIPVSRAIVSLKMNADNHQDICEKFLATLQDSHLPPLVEIILELAKPDTELTDRIREKIHSSNADLISLSTIFPQNNDIKPDHEDKLLNNLKNPKQLFREYYTNKYPDTDSVPDDIIHDFMDLLQYSNDIRSNEGALM